MLLPVPQGEGSYTGAWDKRLTGCFCHSAAANSAVVIEIAGFPARYDLGSTYEIAVTLVSTPVNQSGPRRAGFNAEVSQGSLSVPGDMVEFVQAVGKQATHSFNGTNRTTWSLTWIAPTTPSGVVTLWVLVNSVNGDGAATPSDQWGSRRLESVGPSPNTGGGSGLFNTATPTGSALTILLLLAPATGLFAFGAWWLRRDDARRKGPGATSRKRRRRRREPPQKRATRGTARGRPR